MLPTITLRINGKARSVSVEPETPLLYVLRNDLELKSAKFACGDERCGACKVIVDGYAVPSCKVPVRYLQGREIITLEGLPVDGNLHPLQEAFIEEQATQCGYCTPGMIMAAKALLDRNPNPTSEEIRSDLQLNLCRCGAYDRVLRAVRRAAGDPHPHPPYQTQTEGEVIPVQPPSLPRSLLQTPDLDDWVRINADGTISLFTGKVELGQGILTAVAQIGAEELDVALHRIRVMTADTAHSPNEGLTVGSMSLETTGNAIRYAAAEARHFLLSVAFEELEAPLERLAVNDGTIRDLASGRSITYWDLFGGKKFGRLISGAVLPKQPEAHTLVGRSARRLDLEQKVKGEPLFLHDMEVADMLHGRVVRPPHYKARLISVDEQVVSKMPGVLKVIHDGSFLAVIARRESQAVKAAETLRERTTWAGAPNFPAQDALFDHMLAQEGTASLLVEGTPVDGPVPPVVAPETAARTLSATYTRPFQMHASLGPSAAMALMEDGTLTVWSHSQGIFLLKSAIAQALGMEAEQVRVIHKEGPGCYGHNGADDAALDAALLARAMPGQPVMLKWSRSDEHAWEPYGPAMLMQMQASLDEEGQVVDWNHDVWGYPHFGRPRPGPEGTSGFIAAWHRADHLKRPEPGPSSGRHSGIHRNADPIYAFSRRRVVRHFAPNSPLRTSSLRGLGAFANVFAIESFIDELAHAAGADPVAFRLRHLTDERAKAVIEAAAEKGGWQPDGQAKRDGRGQGIAFAQYKNLQAYVAVLVELSVDMSSGLIRLERATIAADAGQIVNPDGLSNQLEGGFVQSASYALKEQVRFDQFGIISLDWSSYPILPFSEAPSIETVLINRPGRPFMGCGEAVQGPAPAAIANAVFNATGVRLRHIPFTPHQVKAAGISD